jgi:hypothetical protein
MAKKQPEPQMDMTLEEARAFRASLIKEALPKSLSQKQKREAFKVYWTQNKKRYGMTGKLEHVLWLHLVATKNDEPANFEAGLKNFGIKKV